MLIKPIIYIVLGIVIGIAFTKLFTSSNPCPQITAITKPSILKEQTTKTAIHFQQKLDSLNLVAKDLKYKLTNNKAALAIAKNKTLVLQTQLVAAKQKEIVSNEEAGTINCPPEENLLAEFILANNHKDSLYETIDSTRERQLLNKDASLAIKDSMYQALQQSFHQTMAEQQILYTQNSLMRKQINRQKVKGKLVSAAMLIISASAVRYLVK